MLKEFAQYLVSLKDNKTYTIHGDTYQQPRGGRQQASTGEKMGALRNLHDAFSGEGER